jgi:hypothetical protein
MYTIDDIATHYGKSVTTIRKALNQLQIVPVGKIKGSFRKTKDVYDTMDLDVYFTEPVIPEGLSRINEIADIVGVKVGSLRSKICEIGVKPIFTTHLRNGNGGSLASFYDTDELMLLANQMKDTIIRRSQHAA